ncbi:MAG TPA: glycosyltransferase [Candidatus Limnocylindrales bacterium]|nr:glycosyltransferase [Candidatus Limnocylindrales bacterium]
MTVHLLGLPHTETTRAFSWCAYTEKVRKLATMLTRLGERVVVYGGEASDAECAEHVAIVSREEQAAWFAGWDPARSYWDPPRAWETDAPWWQAFNERAAAAIRERAEPRDVLSITMGTSHRPVAEALAHLELMPVETGIGYKGVWAPYRVFESHAWRNFVAAKQPDDVVRFYDEVIPNYFEAEAFPRGTGQGGYFLFMGRLIGRKGPQIAAQACARIGAKLIVAGQGALSWSPRLIVCQDGTRIEGDVEYVGVVGPEERARLMGEAIATFVPTMYLEPFGGVSVEAQLTGTPAIVSDYGGLVENVNGVGGYRCRTLAEFAAAAERAGSLDRDGIRDHALATWSTEVIGPRYLEYFARLASLWGEGWYS